MFIGSVHVPVMSSHCYTEFVTGGAVTSGGSVAMGWAGGFGPPELAVPVAVPTVHTHVPSACVSHAEDPKLSAAKI